ncbi:MAG: sel1 repeat family protein [Candidatus Omnitrophota bacterium]|nr:MAG: sel1 repeat family protein [Candidatus Omnitrophota bacterium]
MRRLFYILIIYSFLVSGCAGLNPNPGERITDMAWDYGNYSRALSIIRPAAEKGEPWAQLRLGAFYELGAGVDKNIKEAIRWYGKAAVQQGQGGWAKGLIVGSMGRSGYFNQHSDALVAQYQLANIYLQGDGAEKDLTKAYLLIKNVAKESEGNDIFFCQMPSGDRWIPVKMVKKTLMAIKKEMSKEEIEKAELLSKTWTPQKDL